MDPLSTCLLFEQFLAQRRYLKNVTPSTDSPPLTKSSLQQFVVSNGAVPEVEVRMEQVPATIIRVVDAGTGAPVNADVSIKGTTINSMTEMAVRVDAGTFKVWLRPGNYRVQVGAPGYPYKSVNMTTPTADVNIAITH